eukprot:gene25798-31154_t
MGNASGAKAEAGVLIGIELANGGQPVMVGGLLQGKVYLQVHKESVTAQSLALRLNGDEKTCVVSTGGKDDSKTYHHGCSVIIRFEAIIAQFPTGELAQGHYEFPFILTIPPGLPGTQGKFMEERDCFSVQYRVEVELTRQPVRNVRAPNPRNSVEVFLCHPTAGPPVPSTVPPLVAPMMFCCCIAKGTAQLTAHVDNTSVVMGESFNLDYGIQNMSRLKVDYLAIRLIETVRGKAHPFSFTTPQDLCKLSISASEIPGTRALEKGEVYHSVPGQDNTLKRLAITVPICRPTYTGVSGSVSHVLLLMLKPVGCTLGILMEIPMTIYTSRLMFQNMVPSVEVPLQRPADWQPQNAGSQPIATGSVVGISPPPPPPAAAAAAAGPGADTAALHQDSSYFGGGAGIASGLLSSSPHSAQALLQQLRSSNEFLEVSVVRQWLSEGGRVEELTPDVLQGVFGCLRQGMSHSSVAEDLGAAMRGRLTLLHVAGAARGAPELQKTSVCIGFSRYVQDKASARSVLSDAGLSPSALEAAMVYYH